MRISIRLLFCGIICSLAFSSCKKDYDDNFPTSLDLRLEEALNSASNGVGNSFYIMPASNDFSAIPQDPKNPLTLEKVELGKLLYHETGIAITPIHSMAEGSYSCASCHFASAGFQAGRFQGISEGGTGFGINGEGREAIDSYIEENLDVQPIRSPSVLNTVYQSNLLWNGQFGATGVNTGTESSWTLGTPKEANFLGYQGMETQAIAGLKVHRMDIDSINSVIEDLGYKTMFDDAFSNVPENERYSRENTGLAIAAYERTILANESPFQKWLKGDKNAMTDQEKRGAYLFFADAGCASCHNGPGLNSMEFHAIGTDDLVNCPEETFLTAQDNVENLGRGGFTGEEEDLFKFKVPQLYNLSDSPFYGHGSSFRSIRSVVEYKNAALKQNPMVPNEKLSNQFVPLNLSDEEINDLTIFIKFALYDPNLDRYVPESLPSGNCFPFNDSQSRIDLGCN